MLTSEVKQKIDAARQVLVGKIPNPIGQVQEITNALIYKFMDDMDEKAVSMGGKRRYFSGDYEKYSWRTIMNPKIGAHERLIFYTEALSKMSENPNIPELFRNIFRNAYLPFNDPRTLTLFLNEVNFFDYKKTEELGDAYEYLLSIMGSQGDAGQFRTPRHIIDFIVKAVNPTKDDSVLDPACGTAGFLISAYKHVMNKHDGINDDTGNPNPKEKLLTADEKNKLHKNYKGFDIDDNMVKISQVNLYLHGFPDPNIIVHDTLSSEDFWNDRYDIILANPPFMSPKGGIVPHSKFGVKSNRSEVLFVDYIVSHLKPKGRAGIIVPEGIIFQSGNAYKQLRKNLVEDGLYAVVSLPSGVFNPYAGVKTSILLFDNDISKQRDEMLFIKIENDGFDLGAQRKPIVLNDLPTALDILDKWKKGEKVENSIATYVKKSKIADNEENNLSGNRYRAATDYTNAKWPMVELGKLCEITTGRKDVNEGNPKGEYPFFTCAKENTFIDTFSFDTEALLIAGNGDVGAVKHYKGKFDAYQRTYVLSNFKNVNVKYLYNILNDSLKGSMQLQKQGNTMPYIKLGMLETFLIPSPPLEIQEQIVAELDGYQKIIDGAKQVVDKWKPRIDIDPKWEKVRLEEICERLFAGGDVPKDSYSLEKNSKYQIPVYTNGVNDKSLYGFTNIAKVNRESVTISARGTIGYTAIRTPPFYPAVRLIVAIPDIKKVNIYFLKYSLDSLTIYRNGNSIPQLTIPMISNEQLSLPPINLQRQIVEKIENERKIVEANKELIETYEQKIKDVIYKLWEE